MLVEFGNTKKAGAKGCNELSVATGLLTPLPAEARFFFVDVAAPKRANHAILGATLSQPQILAGDTVNVASRLMEVAASHGAELAASDELLHAAGPDCALLNAGSLNGPEETGIRGRSGSLTIWLWRSSSESRQHEI